MKYKFSASWDKAPGGGKSSNRNIKLTIKRQRQFKVFNMQKNSSCKKLGSSKDHNPLSVMAATGEGCIYPLTLVG